MPLLISLVIIGSGLVVLFGVLIGVVYVKERQLKQSDERQLDECICRMRTIIGEIDREGEEIAHYRLAARAGVVLGECVIAKDEQRPVMRRELLTSLLKRVAQLEGDLRAAFPEEDL